MNLRNRHLLTLKDFTKDEMLAILERASEIKARFKAGESVRPLEGKMMAMIFQKPSLRTRVSFETGIFQLGGASIYLGPSDIGLGKRETVEDIATVLSAQVDVIMARVFGHKIVEDMAEYSAVPVINGLSDYTHPCQALADLLTIMERGKAFEGLTLTYVGDANNVSNSLIFSGVQLGMHVVVASPKGYQVPAPVAQWAAEAGAKCGGKLSVTDDVKAAAEGADVLYSDVWASMGQESEAEARKKAFAGYQINMELLNLAKKDAIVLHCLPAHYGDEITYDVSRDPRSAIFQQAENRLHAQKGLLATVV